MIAPHRLAVCLSVVAVTGALAGCHGTDDADAELRLGTWTTAPPMHHARAAHAVVATSDAIYALAGTDADGLPVTMVERFGGYDWQYETPLPGDGLNAPAAVALDGRIYLIGGFRTVTNVPTTKVHVYDTRTREWSKAAELPSARGGHAAAVLNGLIHVVGGGNSRSTLADHSVFDPRTNNWSERAPLPRAVGSPALVAMEGKLYAIGGRSGAQDFGDVWVYDDASNAWSAGPSIGARATCGAVALPGVIFVFGGESQARSCVLADVLWLREGAEAWDPVQAMPTARSFARAVVFDGNIYIVGGSHEPQKSHAPRGSAAVDRLMLPSPPPSFWPVLSATLQ